MEEASAPVLSFSEKWQGASLIDGKTPINFFVGMFAGLSGLSAAWAMVAVVGYEASLIMLDEGLGSAVYKKRSAQGYGNRAVDTLMGIAGAQYGAWLRRRRDQQQAMAQLQRNMEVSGVSWHR